MAPVRRAALLVALLAALGCGGMLGIFIPDLPVVLPSDARVFNGREKTEAGVSTTRVHGITDSTDLPTLERHLRDQLLSDGWDVSTSSTPEGVVLTGTRDGASVAITLQRMSGQGGCEYEVVWVHGA
ncbi:MAG: hypothetical protein H6737_22260 [Alphaproteobacteria bacterium]|nr:hypothetical protein [Alphaproteobacteria bacterium]